MTDCNFVKPTSLFTGIHVLFEWDISITLNSYPLFEENMPSEQLVQIVVLVLALYVPAGQLKT